MIFSSFIKGFVHVLMPNLCRSCDNALYEHEHIICLECLYHLPVTDFHLDKNNESAKQLWGKVDFQFASSMLYLNKSSRVERLVHRLKFKGFSEIGEYLGAMYASELKNIQPQFDYIIPVPIHSSKLRTRGYNQAECFAIGLSKGLSIPVLNGVLIRTINSQSQTTQARLERYDNVEHVFELTTEKYLLNNKHILIVDDVLTTGATLSVVGNVLIKEGAKVSFVTLARA